MTRDERRPWLVIASLFVTLFFVFPTGNAFGVFLPYLVMQFNCSRAQGASLFSLWTITLGLSAPFVGRLLDRFNARHIMATGVITCGAAVLWASRTESFNAMVGAYLLMGLGAGLSCIVPCSVVTARWFSANRGVAMGVVFAGTSSGASVMTLALSYAAVHAGWRAAYLLLALPMLVVALPLQFLTAKTLPAGSRAPDPNQDREPAGTGLTVSAAVMTRSFWLIALAQFCFTFVVTAMVAHLFSYLLDCGYPQQSAALVVSLTLVVATFGKPLMGRLADRLSARRADAMFCGRGGEPAVAFRGAARGGTGCLHSAVRSYVQFSTSLGVAPDC